MIFLLNGPPYSGKDTAANLLAEYYTTGQRSQRFSEPIKRAIPYVYGITVEEFQRLDQMPFKELPQECFLGLSPRQVQIDFSEKYLKPIYGEDVFGRLFMNKYKELPGKDVVLVPDSGFVPEAMQVIQAVGAENVTLIRVHKDGCNFNTDSRGYIELPVSSFDITNIDGDFEGYKARLLEITESRLRNSK